jgi:hypothetical protein
MSRITGAGVPIHVANLETLAFPDEHVIVKDVEFGKD